MSEFKDLDLSPIKYNPWLTKELKNRYSKKNILDTLINDEDYYYGEERDLKEELDDLKLKAANKVKQEEQIAKEQAKLAEEQAKLAEERAKLETERLALEKERAELELQKQEVRKQLIEATENNLGIHLT